jgi:hypothetical protein
LAKAKKQAPPATTGSQIVHNLALRSIATELEHNISGDPEDPERLFVKHSRKQDHLAKKAVDDFHSHLAESN